MSAKIVFLRHCCNCISVLKIVKILRCFTGVDLKEDLSVYRFEESLTWSMLCLLESVLSGVKIIRLKMNIIEFL